MATAKNVNTLRRAPGRRNGAKVVAELKSKTGRLLEERTRIAARLVEDEAQAGNQQRLVDRGARRGQGRRRFSGSLSEKRWLKTAYDLDA